MGKKTQAGRKEMEWRISDWRDHPDLTAEEMVIRWNCTIEAAKTMIRRKNQYLSIPEPSDLNERIAEIAHLKMVVENQKAKLREFALLLEEKEKRIDSLKERVEICQAGWNKTTESLDKAKEELHVYQNTNFDSEIEQLTSEVERERTARLKAEERLSKALKKIGEFYMNKENEG